MYNYQNFINKHIDKITVIGLCILYYFIFFYDIGNYPLMDADETRYVLISRDMFNSKDFLTLYLNGEYFFEKPPLFFWLECLSFKLFGVINEFTARFPVAMLGTIISFMVYFTGKKILSKSYGVISSVILATSLEFLILSKFAILDIVVSACVAISLSFGIAVYFCRESRKKYYWWLFYLFSALAVIAKGIPGFVLPFGSMFFIGIFSKKLKDYFKPIYILPGILLFLLITLPWHIIMFKIHNPLFWNEYIIKHHVERFLGSITIHRSEPVYFYFITLLWGFFPWIFSLVAVLIKNIKKFFKFNFFKLSNINRFLMFNIIIVLFILIFFSSSKAKLITYILPLYPFLAYLAGFIWWKYIKYEENATVINKTNYILGGVFITISLFGFGVEKFLPDNIVLFVADIKFFVIILFLLLGVSLVIFTKKKIYKGVFISFVIFITLISAFGTRKFFELDYKLGQYELMDFAKIAERDNVGLTTFRFGTKFSLNYYGSMPVIYAPQKLIFDINKALGFENNYVIIKNKDLKDYDSKIFDIIKKERKYSLIDKRREI